MQPHLGTQHKRRERPVLGRTHLHVRRRSRTGRGHATARRDEKGRCERRGQYQLEAQTKTRILLRLV